MENQVDIGDQNTQQIGQNPVNQSLPVLKKSKTNLIMIGGIVLACFIVFGFGGYYLGRQSSGFQNYVHDGQNQVFLPSPTPDPTVNWKTYTSQKYGFTIKYPQSWEVASNPNDAASKNWKEVGR